MATIQGIPNPNNFEYIEVSRRFDNSGANTGPVWTFVYRGSKDALRLASLEWSRVGAKYTINEEGPYSEATVIYSGTTVDPGEPITSAPTPVAGQEIPDIRYEFRTDYNEVSLFSLPAVIAEATSTGNISLYKFLIETAVKNGEALPTPPESNIGNFAVAQKVWQMLNRGQDSFSMPRNVLTRYATFSGNLGLPQTPQTIPPVYTPFAFVQAWNLFGIQNMLPTPPSDPMLTPPGTAWGWRQTNYATNLIIKTNQVEQTISWTFAPWDLLVYPFI